MAFYSFSRQARYNSTAKTPAVLPDSTYAGYGGPNQGTSPSNAPLGRGGAPGLRDILERYYLPELSNRQDQLGPIFKAFSDQASTPGALFGAAKTSAEAYGADLFKPGGEIASAIKRVRGQTIGAGFAPSGAEGGERGILNAGVTAVGNRFAQEAAGLETTRFGGLAALYTNADQATRDILDSIFTGTASAEQLGLAKNPPRQKFLGIF